MPGVLELLPLEQVAMQQMLDVIRSEFERFGFLPIATPSLELVEVLLTKTGGETERQVYLTQSSGSRSQGYEPDLALRFDLTVPLARYVAEHEQDLAFPFRRYQIQPVFRGESPQHGRYREFIQCDIDVVGRDTLSIRYDAEIPAVINAVFERLAFGPFTIKINNRKLLWGLLGEVGVTDKELQVVVLREVDKLERKGPDAVARALRALGMDAIGIDRLLTQVGGGPARGSDIDKRLAALGSGHPLLAAGVEELREVFALIGAQRVPSSRYALDLAIARGLDYYTGTVYETSLDAHPGLGSICSGGRYDDLAGFYTTSRLPGVGISIGLTRLFGQLQNVGLVKPAASTVAVVVVLLDEEGLGHNLEVATRLREAGINTEVVLEPARLGTQLKRAGRAGIRLAVVIGEDERTRQSAVLRDLTRQVQETVLLDELVLKIRDRLENAGDQR
jgi:histidyl-tRNA synthetase